LRSKVTEKAWQRIIREQIASEERVCFWDHCDLDLKKAVVRPTTRYIAEKIILEYEWLGTLPIASFYVGLFFDDVCAGVCCFALGSTGPGADSTAKMYGLRQKDFAYLMRGACTHWSPFNSASYLISRSLKLLPKELKVCIAYSDTDAGEYGTVYQSCNWLCLGRGKNGLMQLISPNGQIRDQMFINDQAKKNQVSISYMRQYLLDNGWIFQRKNPKYRYCKILHKIYEKEILQNINHLITDYPKRSMD
jgi:hypothetical protein